MFSAQPFVVHPLHDLLGPRFDVGIGEIGNAKCRLGSARPKAVVGHVGVTGIVSGRAVVSRDDDVVEVGKNPRSVVG